MHCTIHDAGSNPEGPTILSWPVVDIHQLNSGQKVNMIMCARFNLSRFISTAYPSGQTRLKTLPYSSEKLFFYNFLLIFTNDNAIAQSANICDQLLWLPSTLKMKRFSLKIMPPYIYVACVCLCMYYFGQNDFVLKIGNQNRKKKCHAETAWVSQTDTHFYDTRTRTSGGSCK